MTSLFAPAQLGGLTLQNRLVMAPMTRSRAIGNVPNELMATYYAQRSAVGLVITEGTSPSKDGLGYPRIPGSYTPEQQEGWRKVAQAVHAGGAKLFIQLMHTGRVAHPLNLPPGGEVIAPSAVAAGGKMHTDQQGPQPHPVPRAMNADDLGRVVAEFVHASRTAIAAGADGVELHAANGYLLEQFLSPGSNQRTDRYGGSIENRIRFVVEVASAVAQAIGGGHVGIRLSPHGTNGDMKPYEGVDETYRALVSALVPTGVQYVHVVDHSSMGAPPVPAALKASVRAAWPRTMILCGGFDRASAEAALAAGQADLIAFGRPLLATPDFVKRLERGQAMNAMDFSTAYTPGEKGYTDYPLAS